MVTRKNRNMSIGGRRSVSGERVNFDGVVAQNGGQLCDGACGGVGLLRHTVNAESEKGEKQI